MTTIKFAKVRPTATIPSKERENAGYDIYADFSENTLFIPTGETVLIPTGIASCFRDNYVMILKERGSTGTKGIAQRCGVIDSGFRGEWKVPVTNVNNFPIVISKLSKQELEEKYPFLEEEYIYYPYEKAISQAILLELPDAGIEEVSYEEILAEASNRGTGMLGSSGK